jgi:hypothetical protein
VKTAIELILDHSKTPPGDEKVAALERIFGPIADDHSAYVSCALCGLVSPPLDSDCYTACCASAVTLHPPAIESDDADDMSLSPKEELYSAIVGGGLPQALKIHMLKLLKRLDA